MEDNTESLSQIGSMRSAVLWITRYQRRISEIPWLMWQHQNEFIHNDGKTIHFQEIAAINQSIRNEYRLTDNSLPESYQYVFQDNVEVLIEQTISKNKLGS